MNKHAKIYVAGHTGLVGSAIVRALHRKGYDNLVLKTHESLDLLNQAAVLAFFSDERPEYVIDAAALVGGIKANAECPADFFFHNMEMENNLIWASHIHGVKKFLFLGSACMYPKNCVQPMQVKDLLSGPFESTNEGYALAKMGGLRLCEYLARQYGECYISIIPANTYGIGDSFDLETSHVIPALIKKYLVAQRKKDSEVILWGTGTPLREFIYVDDLADGCVFLLENYTGIEPVNLGISSEISILELSRLISRLVGFDGNIVCDHSRPDGMMRRIMDSSFIFSLGWRPKVSIEDGLRRTIEWYLGNLA
ncbi:MAG: GDP-L-fucose synthase [Sphaerochaetaceae bacterium]|nr:GDP-L-fucose synthase [Sphaerochaetaceae bacterium]